MKCLRQLRYCKCKRYKQKISFGYLHLHKNSYKIFTNLLTLLWKTKPSCSLNINTKEHLNKFIKSEYHVNHIYTTSNKCLWWSPETGFKSWALVRMQTAEVINYIIMNREHASSKSCAPHHSKLELSAPYNSGNCCPGKHPDLKSFHKFTLYKYCNKTNNAEAYLNICFLQLINYKGKVFISYRK